MAVGNYEDSDGIRTAPLAEAWNGVAWRIEATPNTASGEYQSVDCPSKSDCIATGVSGREPTRTLAGQWNGKHWTKLTTPDPSAKKSFGGDLESVDCTSATNCWAVGYYTKAGNFFTTLIERWSGKKWTVVSSAQPATIRGLNQVSCTSPTRCEAVGSPQPVENNRIDAERWNGKTWSNDPVAYPSDENYIELNSVSCVGSRCTAVGDYVNSDNAGLSFAEQR
jgi:hypothetical protein